MYKFVRYTRLNLKFTSSSGESTLRVRLDFSRNEVYSTNTLGESTLSPVSRVNVRDLAASNGGRYADI